MGLTKAQLEALNISSFPNNTSELITPEILRTYNSASIANTVNQDAYTTDSASFNSRIDSIVTGTGFVTTSSFNAYTSSNDSKVNSLINATASYANSASVAVVNNAQQAQINSLIAFTGSNTNTSLNSYTASNDTKWSNLGAQTGSFITESETGSFATSAITASSLITASISGQTLTFTKGDASTFGVIIPTGSGGGTTDITSLNAFTASQLTINAGYNTTTASLLVETANLELFSASTLTRLTNIETTTASLNSSVTQLNANTASQQSQIDSLISATGSYSTSSVSLTSLNSFTSSQLTINTAIGASTSSLNSFTSSQTTINTNLNLSSSKAITTASVSLNTITFTKGDASTFNITVNTGSATTTDITALNTFTASQETKDITLASVTSSLNSATASLFTSTSLSLTTASFSGNTLTFTKGNGTTFGVVIPDVSGSAGNFVTTSSFNAYTASVTQSIVTAIVTNNGSNYYLIDGVAKPKLSFVPGPTYRFDLSGIAGNHPFKFSTTANGPTEYTTGVTSGSNFIQIEVGYDTTTPLYYYCTNHSGMGNEINVLGIDKLVTTASFNSYTSSTNGRLTNIESTTASLLVETQNLELFSASALISINALSAATASYVTETESGSFLITASFSGNTLTFTKGNNTTFGVVIPDISGSTIDTGSFVTTSSFNSYTSSNNQKVNSLISATGSYATTGSNIFVGTQNIKNSLIIEDPTNQLIYTQLDQNSVNGLFQFYQAGGNGYQFNNNVQITGNLTASLQEGYAWVGGAGNISKLVATSSFGTSINTGSFATTGSNAFFGTNTFSGAVSFTGSAPSILSQSFSGSLITNLTDIYTDVAAVQQIVTLTSASYAALASGSLTNPNTLYIVSGSTSGSGGGTTDITSLNAFTASQNILNTTFATTGSNTFRGNQVITGSLTISSSAVVDLIITGAAKIVDVTGLAGLSLSPNSINVNTTKTALSADSYIFAGTGSDASFYLGVYDDPNFNTDVELKIKADTNGLSFNDWDNVTAADYVPFMSVAPNLGNNPAPRMTRGLQVTGSLVVTGSVNITGQYLVNGVPISGGASINTGSFATTGSNSFNGNQTITGSLNVRTITTLGLNATPSTANTGSGTSLYFLNQDINGGAMPNIYNIEAGWVMSGTGITNGIVTSVGSDDNGFFATITSGNVVSGSSYIGTGPYAQRLIITGGVYTDGNGFVSPGGLTIQNFDGTGGQYGAISINASGVDQTNLFSTLTIYGDTADASIKIGLSSYNNAYNGEPVPTIYAGGNYNGLFGDTDTTMTFYSSSIQNWKPTEFKAPVNITGSLKVSSTFTASLQTGYAWVGGTGNKTIAVATSSFSGTTVNTGSLMRTGSVSGNILTFTKGDATTFSLTVETGSSTTIPAGTVSSSAQILNYGIFATTGSNTFKGSQSIQGSLLQSGAVSIEGDMTFTNKNGDTSNVIIGLGAMLNITGSVGTSIAIGDGAMKYASTTQQNVAIGKNALSVTSGSNNFALGSEAMANNTTGNQNVAIGIGTLNQNRTGNLNVSIGNDTGFNNVSGSRNVYIGPNAGNNHSGDNTVMLGGYSGGGQILNNNIILSDGSGNIRAQYSGSAWSLYDEIRLTSNGPIGVTSLNFDNSGYATLSNSLIKTTSVILITPIGGGGGRTISLAEAPSTGSALLQSNQASTTQTFNYLIINPI